MKKITLLAVVLTIVVSCTKRLQTTLDNRLRQMEAGVNEQQPAQIAAIYADDSAIINPRAIEAQGREAIDAYWQRLGERSTNWQLESFVVSKKLEDILKSEVWQSLERKPRLPEELNMPLPEGDIVYQLGRSHLTIAREGTNNTSVVTFLIIWKKVAGEYRIWMDTYG